MHQVISVTLTEAFHYITSSCQCQKHQLIYVGTCSKLYPCGFVIHLLPLTFFTVSNLFPFDVIFHCAGSSQNSWLSGILLVFLKVYNRIQLVNGLKWNEICYKKWTYVSSVFQKTLVEKWLNFTLRFRLLSPHLTNWKIQRVEDRGYHYLDVSF